MKNDNSSLRNGTCNGNASAGLCAANPDLSMHMDLNDDMTNETLDWTIPKTAVSRKKYRGRKRKF